MSDAEEMMDILEREHAILTSGRFEDMSGLIARKEALERRGQLDADPDPELLARISILAERNAGLIDAARRGFEAGRMELRDIRRGLSRATYGRDGTRTPLSPAPGRVEKKL